MGTDRYAGFLTGPKTRPPKHSRDADFQCTRFECRFKNFLAIIGVMMRSSRVVHVSEWFRNVLHDSSTESSRSVAMRIIASPPGTASSLLAADDRSSDASFSDAQLFEWGVTVASTCGTRIAALPLGIAPPFHWRRDRSPLGDGRRLRAQTRDLGAHRRSDSRWELGVTIYELTPKPASN
jgi:hypothetical protein